MNPTLQIWLPPMLTLLGTLIAVVFAAWLSNRFMEAKIDALRAEMKQGFAELRLEFHTALSGFEHRPERVEERLGVVQK
jgi:peptidoglycan/LPS O-acetylase OafA/YrhL